MNHVTHIESNVKGGVSVPLGTKTLIIGPNGGGKSTITDAVSLALTGLVSDLGGKEVKAAGLLMQLAPEGSGELHANARLADGSIANWSTTGKVGRAKAPDHSPPKGLVMPLVDLRAQLEKAGDDKRRRFFASVACKHIMDADVRNQVPGVLIAEYDAFADRAKRANNGQQMFAMDRLIAVRDIANKAKNTAKREVTGADKLIKTTAASAVGAPLPGELAAAEQRAAETLAAYEALQTDTGAALKAAAHQRNLQSALDACNFASNAIRDIDAELSQLPQPAPAEQQALRDQTLAIYEALDLVATAQASSGKPHCALCANPVEPAAAAARAQAVKAAVADEIAALRANAAADRRRAELMTLRADNLAAYNSNAETYQQLQNNAPAVATESESVSAERAAARLAWQTANEAYNKLTSAAAQNETLQKARDTVTLQKEEYDKYKRLVEVCDDIVENLLTRSVRGFAERVQKYLPKGRQFTLQLKPFKVGLEVDGHVRTALSGAEWSMVTLAIGCVLSEDHELAVLIPEERAYDPKTLKSMMVAMSKAPCQILITSPVKPRGKAPKGWTVIDVTKLDEASAAAALPPEKDKPHPAMDSSDGSDDDDPAIKLDKPNEDAPVWARLWGRCRGTGTTNDLDRLWLQAFGDEARLFRQPKEQWQYEMPDGQAFRMFSNGAVLRMFGSRIFLYDRHNDAFVQSTTEQSESDNLVQLPTQAPAAEKGDVPDWVQNHGNILTDSVRNSAGFKTQWEQYFGTAVRRVPEEIWDNDGHEWMRYPNGAVLHNAPSGAWYLYAPVGVLPASMGSALVPNLAENLNNYQLGDSGDEAVDTFIS